MSAGDGDLPLSPQLLLEVLQAASSPSQELLQKAATQLKTWETTKGYYSLLQDAFFDKSLPNEIRWQAIIQLKNGVDKYWRSSQPNALSKEEKQHIRSNLLKSVDEEIPQLARQNAVMVAKVGRIDYPLNWPNMFTDLISIIRDTSDGLQFDGSASTLRLERALELLLAVVKEQASGRLTRTKANLQAIAPELFRVVGGLYLKYVETWTSLLRDNAQGIPIQAVENMMGVSLLILKSLRRLITSGYEFPNRHDEVQEMWKIFQQHLVLFLEITTGNSGGESAQNIVRKHVTNLGKLFLDMAASHAAAFALLPDTLELLKTYWNVVLTYGDELTRQADLVRAQISSGQEIEGALDQGDESAKYAERVALQGALLLRSCAKMIFNPTQTFKYRHQAEREETEQAKNLFKSQLFTPQMVSHCMEILVTRYFMLKASDLQDWREDPEVWSTQMEDTTESWEFLIRPCAEKLFTDLITWFKDLLVQPLVNVFQSVAASEDQDVLTKDAVYTAVGLAAQVLHPHINFDSFLQTTLVKEVQVSRPGYNILRRRIAILIGQWVPVKVSVEVRGTVYEITKHLLNRDDPLNDLVVRLSAARYLRYSVYEWDFKLEDFLPYVDEFFSKLLALIEEVEGTETKMSILSVLSAIIERLGNDVVPYSERIIQILPPLWEQTGEEHLFKQSILAILTKLVTAMGEKSSVYAPLLIQMIRFSVEPGPMQIYLLEEALELWDAVIKATQAPASPELLSLAGILIGLLERGSDTLKRILDITEGYVLLAPREIIDNYGLQLFRHLTELLGSLKTEASSILTTIVESVIRIANLVGGEGALKVVAEGLVTSGFISGIFVQIRDCYDARQSTGPNKSYSRVTTLIETHYFELIGRLCLANTELFINIVEYIASQRNETVEQTFKWLLDEWFSHFSNIGHPRPRKLNCLALTCLFATKQPWILLHLQDLMTVWTDVITELRDDEVQGGETLIYWPTDTTEEDTPELARRKFLGKSDPVNTVHVGEFVKQRVQQVQAEMGHKTFVDEWVVNVDTDVVRAFEGLGLF